MTLDGSVLDYLRAMEDLSERGIPLRNGAIAEALEIKPPSVTQMLDRLRELGFVAARARGKVELTGEGRRLARRGVRRHRLIETWLVQSLGLPWDIAHEEAHSLEHAFSDRLEEVLDRRLGRPAHDPHGAAIPDRDGKTPQEAIQPFEWLADGEAGVVVRLCDRDPEKLAYWSGLGIALGIRLERTRTEPFGEAVHVKVDGAPLVVGLQALEGVWIRPVEPEHA